MKALSAATHIPNAYRAGMYLGEQLRSIQPEIVFLFSSIDYSDNNDILMGLNDGLENPNCLIIGNSGDGFYETNGIGEYGASALALNSEGKVQWQLKIGYQVKEHPQQATRQALAQHQNANLIFMVSDFHADASLIEQVLEHEVTTPVVGGLAADDQQWHGCALYHNQQVLNDCIVALHAIGDIKFSVHIENSISPIGDIGQINASFSNRIDAIDQLDAMRFIEKQTGKPILRSDRGSISLTIIDHQQQLKRLRSIKSDIGEDANSVFVYGGIPEGQKVQVCIAQPEQLIEEVYRVAQQAQQKNHFAVAAIVVSCAGRKSLLGAQLNHEVDAVKQHFNSLPMIGFPSLGEIGPLKNQNGQDINLFHNMTYVLLLINS
ncbi:MAG: FIST C-terminal domain-containing protein [Agitococcus sp.]